MHDDAEASLAGVPVLIVQDEPASARIIATTLETHGCETRIARSAEEAVALLAPFSPRMIVLDLVLPQLSGLLLAAKLTRDPATGDIPIIATSVFSAQDAADIARSAGCVDYVRKPIDPSTFVLLLRDHLERTK